MCSVRNDCAQCEGQCTSHTKRSWPVWTNPVWLRTNKQSHVKGKWFHGPISKWINTSTMVLWKLGLANVSTTSNLLFPIILYLLFSDQITFEASTCHRTSSWSGWSLASSKSWQQWKMELIVACCCEDFNYKNQPWECWHFTEWRRRIKCASLALLRFNDCRHIYSLQQWGTYFHLGSLSLSVLARCSYVCLRDDFVSTTAS